MILICLTPELVELIHERMLYANELSGKAPDESLESALARVDNRLTYGLIEDAFSLASCYAAAISQGHCFHDGNKRTAFAAMDTCLDLNGIEIQWDTQEVGDKIIALAQSRLNEEQLAQWMRQYHREKRADETQHHGLEARRAMQLRPKRPAGRENGDPMVTLTGSA